ncbi:probable arginine--tRNA ligase, mitochondrial isoform X2 [Stegodyphus dumicola]|nr:probable arginine--tRNA ligase, mitochondrial isoform X2 [Stegodyphus dumicola]XP_035227727.1 probable arginine--tRNA ligase, mitochondrial isoform X2 [Stegodyphus dumicola]
MSHSRGRHPQLLLSWKKITSLSSERDFKELNPSLLVKLLRNQGLPTAEGFIDITLCEASLNLLFTVDEHVFSKIVLMDICTNDDLAKTSCLFENISPKRILVDCCCPLIGEPLHMAHFRSAIYSNFISNINKFAGHEVVKVTHFGDWGLASAALLTGYKCFDVDQSVEDSNAHLLEMMKSSVWQYKNDANFKENARTCYNKLENGDQDLLSEWNYLKNLYMNYYDSVYKRIGLTFDDTHFDSHFSQEIKEMHDNLLKKDLVFLEEDGGIKIQSLETASTYSLPSNIDSPLYHLSRTIFAAIHRKEKYDFDVFYYVTSASQKNFFSVVFSLLQKLGFEWVENLQHIKLNNRQFESKRQKKLEVEDTLNKAKSFMLKILEEELYLEVNENLEKMAELLGVSSLCINDMKHRKNTDFDFDWQDVLTFGRQSGASFQFCHAGLKGLREDSKYGFSPHMDTSPLMEPEGRHLVQHLSRFDEMFYKSYIHLEPCFIFQYLSTLWHLTDKATNVLKLDVKEDRIIVIKARLLLLSATRKILQQGLHLLGIAPLENIKSSSKFPRNVK